MVEPDEARIRAADFARIADATPVPMWVSRLDRTRRFANRAYCDFLGLDYEAALVFDWRTILHPDDVARITAESIAGEATLRPFSMEARYRRADGEWRWIRSISQPQFAADGRHIGFVGVAHDVTDAKAAEQELRAREQRLAAMVEQTSVGVSQTDLDGRFTLVNQRFCEIVGHPRQALLGRTMQSITHPDDRSRDRQLFEAAVRDGGAYTHEKRCLRADGDHVWVSDSVTVIRRPDRSAEAVLAISTDVTDRRAAEAALRENAGRLAFLDALGRASAAAVRPEQVLAVATRMLGEHLGLLSCAYADVDADGDTFHIRGDWHADDAASTVGSYRLASFGSRAAATIGAGEPLVVNDTAAELGEDDATGFSPLAIRAAIWVPLVKEGVLIALMAIHAGQPRQWREEDLALLRDVADRSWAHVERVRSQIALATSDERLRMAVEGGQIGTWDYDLVNRTGAWSARTYSIMGVEPGTPVTPELRASLIHPEDRETTLVAVARLALHGSRVEQEYRICRRDGVVRWVATHGMILRDANGQAVRATGTMRDVTERRTAQAALASLNQTLEQRVADRTAERDRMWRLSRDLLVVIGPRWTVRAVNPAIGAFGYGPDEVVGMRIDRLIHPDDREAARRAIRAGARGPVDDFVARLATATGEWRHLSWTAAPGEGEAYVIGRDVTGEIGRRAELEEARDALRQAQKVEAIGQLTGGVAHDFNNLLTPILGNLDLLQRMPQADPARRERLIGSAMEAANRARTLVQRLLAFARRQPLRPGAVDLTRLVGDMADLIGSTFGPLFRIVVDAPTAPLHATADANQLELALLNLAVNARDAMPAGGVVTLALAPASTQESTAAGLAPGGYIRVSISDTGTGMEEEVLARAIEPFFSTKEAGKGTGLGLSMVHGLASQLGGAMRLASRPGLGTTVTLLLPEADPGDAAAAEVVREAAHPPSARRVLLVDDDAAVRSTTRAMLDHLGFLVSEASSGAEALSAMERDPPDLLVTDHIMPGITGATLARRARERLPGLPVLVISGYAELADLAPDLPRLGKPFRADELSASIAALTR